MRTSIRTTEFPEARFFVSTVDIALIPKSGISGLPPTPASTTPRDHRLNMMLLPKNICVKPCCTTVCPYNCCRQSKTHPFAHPGKFHGKKTCAGSSPRPTMRCKVPKGIPKGETAKRLDFEKACSFPSLAVWRVREPYGRFSADLLLRYDCHRQSFIFLIRCALLHSPERKYGIPSQLRSRLLRCDMPPAGHFVH